MRCCRDLKEKDILNFQWQILKLQMSLEDSFYSLAQDTGKPCVILCDRGAMDGSAYMTVDQWEDLKAEHDLDTVTLRDTCVSVALVAHSPPGLILTCVFCGLCRRYIAIFHLVTAANGAENFYTLENNGIRIESVEQAREIDERTCRAWIGHPKLFIFGTSVAPVGDALNVVAPRD
jgi:hypothetical protein